MGAWEQHPFKREQRGSLWGTRVPGAHRKRDGEQSGCGLTHLRPEPLKGEAAAVETGVRGCRSTYGAGGDGLGQRGLWRVVSDSGHTAKVGGHEVVDRTAAGETKQASRLALG